MHLVPILLASKKVFSKSGKTIIEESMRLTEQHAIELI